MSVIRVQTAKSYDVHIERGILNDCGALIRSIVKPCKAALITDDAVRPLYAARAEASLKKAGYSVYTYAYPNGEAQKTLATIEQMLLFLAANDFSRTDIVVALGGGVCGDMAGFCAAVYMRGIRFVQIPTTLLAMVDSSVGGKTGCNLSYGKNLVGAFYRPELVLCDPCVLDSLSTENFACGIAEAVKCGVILDASLFYAIHGGVHDASGLNDAPNLNDTPAPHDASGADDSLRASDASDLNDTSFDASCARVDFIIESCIRIKANIVAQDEKEGGIRKLLNFGHTVGHAIEKLSNYTVSHGNAVSMGMVAVTRAAELRGICTEPFLSLLTQTLTAHNLPTRAPFGFDELCRAMCVDKKRSADAITLAVPKKLGECTLLDVPFTELSAFFAGASE